MMMVKEMITLRCSAPLVPDMVRLYSFGKASLATSILSVDVTKSFGEGVT